MGLTEALLFLYLLIGVGLASWLLYLDGPTTDNTPLTATDEAYVVLVLMFAWPVFLVMAVGKY